MIRAKTKEWLKKLTKSAGRCDLLWTNTSSGSFSARTISLDLSKYDAVKIEFYSQANADPTTAPLEIIVGSTNSVVLFHSLTAAQTNQNVGTRTVSVTATGVTFGDYSYKNWASGTTRTTYNTACVPYKIYGIKYGGGYYVTSVFSRLSGILCHCRKAVA